MARKVEAGVMFWYGVLLAGGIVGGYAVWTHLTGLWRVILLIICGFWVFLLGSAAADSLFGSKTEAEAKASS